MTAWKWIFDQFDKERVVQEEALLGLANGKLHSRAYFAETFSGASRRKAYLPPYALSDWAGLELEIDGELLDLANAKVEDYQHQLDMQEAYVKRTVQLRLNNKHSVRIESTHFCSWEKPEIIGLRYSITPLNMQATLQLHLSLQAPLDKGWTERSRQNQGNEGYMLLQRNQDYVCSGMRYALFQDAYKLDCNPYMESPAGMIRHSISLSLPKGSQTTIYKFTAHHHSGNYPAERLLQQCQQSLQEAFAKGFTLMLSEQAEHWRSWWSSQHFQIQAPAPIARHFHYSLFQLRQLAGPAGELLPGRVFSPERQQGQDWGQEVFLLPYYLWRGEYDRAQQILDTRYAELPAAQANAMAMGIGGGAAFYPLVSWLGRETHSDTRLAQQQIFRNALIAWAIHYHAQHIGNQDFLSSKGAEMLLAISRFYAERLSYSPHKQAYVSLAVTGPNAYESSVSNNWLTNYLVQWTLRYAVQSLQWLREHEAVRYAALIGKTDLDFSAETRNWERIADSLYLPEYEEMSLFLQQDGYLDKDQLAALPTRSLPLWQHWTEDRRLRSVFLQQADVLWAFYLFPERFTDEQRNTHYAFYAPKTVHEAPLSPALHAILAAQSGQETEAERLWQLEREALQDPWVMQHREGISVPALAGPYLALLGGFVRAKIIEGKLSLSPRLPANWEGYTLKLHWGQHALVLSVSAAEIKLENPLDQAVEVYFRGEILTLQGAESYTSRH